MAWRVGVDIGGTFTDVAVIHEATGRTGIAKVSTTPHDFAEGVVKGLKTGHRGYDPRAFSLVAFGGAGPVHAAARVDDLDIGEIIIPPIPGRFSAFGLVTTDLRRDYSRTYYASIAGADPKVMSIAR